MTSLPVSVGKRVNVFDRRGRGERGSISVFIIEEEWLTFN
jgi:hypothetical protein